MRKKYRSRPMAVHTTPSVRRHTIALTSGAFEGRVQSAAGKSTTVATVKLTADGPIPGIPRKFRWIIKGAAA
jgi:hypothetical protein